MTSVTILLPDELPSSRTALRIEGQTGFFRSCGGERAPSDIRDYVKQHVYPGYPRGWYFIPTVTLYYEGTGMTVLQAQQRDSWVRNPLTASVASF